jgi:hypothetical protein
MSLLKNPGPPLETKIRGGATRLIPEEFLAKLGIDVISQQSPLDIEPNSLNGIDGLLESRVVQERTNERLKTNTYLAGPITTKLKSTVRLPTGQLGKRTRRLVKEGTNLELDALTFQADQDNRGNGLLDQLVVDVDEVFPNDVFGKERSIVTPEDFRALLQETLTESTSIGDAALPTLANGDISKRDEQINVFHHRLSSRSIPVITLPQTITNKATSRYKQIETVARTLELDTTPPTDPTALSDTTFTKLGDGTALEIVTSVPSLFTQASYTKERPVVTPQDFRATLQESETGLNVTGTASAPTLTGGEISRTNEQYDVFNFRQRVRSIDIASLPRTIVNKATNRYKQIETISRILELDTTAPATPTALQDVEFTKLGDGTALEVRTAVPEVFANISVTKSLADLVPEIFRAVFPTYVAEQTYTGIVDPDPTLLPGEFSHREEQVDVFNKRVRVEGRAGATLETPLLVSAEQITEFGGGQLNTFAMLTATYTDPPGGLRYLNSKTTNLGNGLWVVSAGILDDTEWPELIGTEVDPRTGIAVEVRRKVVAAGTTGGVAIDGSYVDVKPLDKWRSIQIASKLDLDTLPESRTWETTIEHRFPNTLQGAEWLWAAASAPFAHDFEMALVLDMVEGYAGPCRAKVTESFSEGAPATTVTPTIFCPQGHLVGFAWAFAADPSGDCGTCIGIARANARTWAIPPTLHDEIEIGGAVILNNGTFTSILPATIPTALPAPGTLITKEVDVDPWRFNIFYRRLVEIYVPECGV